MPEFTELFLGYLSDYGVFVLGVAMFLASSGLPTPTTPLVMAAGAMMRQGLLNGWTAFGILLLGVVAGDIFSYWLGRTSGDWVESRLSTKRRALMNKARSWFARHGSWSIYLTRSLFPSLDVPINLVAGGSNFQFKRFLFWVLAGRVTWLVLFGVMGYGLGSQWERISALTGDIMVWLGLAVVMGSVGFLVLWWRGWFSREPGDVWIP
jgi:membrane protein DedA with SNARE-associated domain